MKIPGFTAELSIYQSRVTYRNAGPYTKNDHSTVKPAYLDKGKIPGRLDPVPDERCFCGTPYCDCVYDCESAYWMCVLGTLGAGKIPGVDLGCDALKWFCKNDCEKQFGKDVRWTCPQHDTSTDPRDKISEIEKCWKICDDVPDAQQRFQCRESCGGI